jgi:hypothetical protein
MNGAFIKRSNPKGIDNYRQRLNKLSKKEIAVGFPKGKAQAYPDGISVIEVAASHQYGVGVPERPFMDEAKEGIEKRTKPILRAITKSQNPNQIKVLQNLAGEEASAAIKKAIVDLKDPPNAPATKAAKGSDNPLIDTTHMLKTVTYVIREKT